MLAEKRISRDEENLPRLGTGKKLTRKSRQDMDRREREVFELRRSGHTLQEITDILLERAEKIFEETGKKTVYFSGITSVKRAYDRYVARAPERFDITGRKEELELAIKRAEDKYKRCSKESENINLDEIARARWSDVAGKWFDRLSKLRALTEDTTIINNFTQNNLVVTDSQLIEKLTAKAVESTILTPDLEAFKSADTVPPMIDAPKQEVEDAEIVINDGEFDEPEEIVRIDDIVQPVGDVKHEEIKAKSDLSGISFSL